MKQRTDGDTNRGREEQSKMSYAYDTSIIYETIDFPFCILRFRPGSVFDEKGNETAWNGKGYGFDYIDGEEQWNYPFTHEVFEPIIAKHYKKDAPETLEIGVNVIDGVFRPETEESKRMRKNLLREYRPFKFTYHTPERQRVDEIYYCSWLSIRPNSDPILLDLIVDRLRDIDRIRASCDNPNIDCQIHDSVLDTINSTTKKRNLIKDAIYINCLGELDTDTKIDIYAYHIDERTGEEIEKLAGRLWVWRNNQFKKIAVLKVKCVIPNLDKNISVHTNKELNQLLHQAQFEIADDCERIVEINLDDYDFEQFKDRIGLILSIRKNPSKQNETTLSLQQYLNHKLAEKLKENNINLNFNKYYKMFYMPQMASNPNQTGSALASEQAAVLFNSDMKIKPETFVHELLHCIHLIHTFNNSEVPNNGNKKHCYTYQYLKTNNLMDYEYTRTRYLLFKWQWESIHKNILYYI